MLLKAIKKIVLLWMIVFSIPLYSQGTNNQPEEAARFVKEKKYEKAYTIYKNLLNKFPKDPKYKYCSGICLYYLNSDLQKGMEDLEFAARHQVPSDVYYYIGRMYHNTYRFNEAINYYKTYTRVASKKTIESFEVHHLIEMASNGKTLTKVYRPIKVLEKDTFSFLSLTEYLSSKSNTFSILAVPDEWKSKWDKKYGTVSYCYKPVIPPSAVFYASTTKKHTKDIVYRKTYDLKPKVLSSTINTPYDEDYAYYNKADKTLYFCSQGHNSMGGYDIFTSLFDTATQTWSEPINMGFPINSPYDDILFFIDSETYFASNRSTPLYRNHYIAYKIVLDSTYDARELPADSLHYFAELRMYTPSFHSKDNPGFLLDEKIKRTYESIVGEALSYQFKADSLMREAKKRRLLVFETPEKMKRTQLFREIRIQEAESRILQHKADILFAQAKEYENKPKEEKQPNKYIILDTIIHSIKVYHYVPEELDNSMENVKKQEISMPDKYVKKKETPIETNNDKNSKIASMDVFAILKASPYSLMNPIPLNEKLPQGVCYKIQLGVFSKPLEPDHFGGVSPISGETLPEAGLTKYYAGIFSNYNQASNALEKIKKTGLKDAFIVSFYNGAKISVSRAKELEGFF